MKSLLLIIAFTIPAMVAISQKQTFDIVTYNPPAGWEKEVKETLISYTTTNTNKRTWCQLVIFKNTVSKGNIVADFESEWGTLAATPFKITAVPTTTDTVDIDGWKVKSGTATFKNNDADALTSLTTFSGYGAIVSVQTNTNSQDYAAEIQKFIESIELYNGKTNAAQNDGNPAPANENPGINNQTQEQTVSASNGFKYNSCNFDDGWTATEKSDWVEVIKGNIKVLLHYPKEGTVFPADPEPLTNAAWNILVAPRYSNLKNYKTAYVNTYNRPYLGMGYATENKTGQTVFVLLFRQGEGWIELIMPDKNMFIQQYKFDPETIKWDSNSDLMAPLANMKFYNKFAVAASDFKGKWTSDFTGIQQLYNVYSGDYAGMHMNQSNEEFVFLGNAYSWKLLVVNGMAGNAKFNQVKSSGSFSVPNNWQVHFTKIESGPKTYNAFWSCIKGARILNLLDAQYPGSGIYTKYGLAK